MKTHKTIWALCLLAIGALVVVAWNPTSSSFNGNQFSAPNYVINIKSGVLLTNPSLSGTISGNVTGTGGIVLSNAPTINGANLTGTTTASAANISNAVFMVGQIWTNPASGNWGYLTVTSTNTQLVNIGTNGGGGYITNTYHFGNGVTSNEFRYFNASGQQVFAMQTNGTVQIGTNNQVTVDASGNVSATAYSGVLLSSSVASSTNSAAGGATVDFSTTETTTNAAGAIAFTAISNFSTTNYNWKIIHVLANGADRTITFAASWKTSGGSCVATNGTQKDLLIEAQIGVFTNASWKSVY